MLKINAEAWLACISSVIEIGIVNTYRYLLVSTRSCGILGGFIHKREVVEMGEGGYKLLLSGEELHQRPDRQLLVPAYIYHHQQPQINLVKISFPTLGHLTILSETLESESSNFQSDLE